MRTNELCQEVAKPVHAQVHAWGAAGKIAAVLGLVSLTGAIIYAWIAGVDLKSLGALGYPGVFLMSFLSSATVLIPVPGLAFTLGAGAIWQPVAVGLVGGLGAGAGEVVGYFAGRASLSIIAEGKGSRWRAADCWLRRFGFWAILLVAMVPNPFFDALGLAAGALAYPLGRFWVAAAAGNCIKYLGFALVGNSIVLPFG